MRNAQHSWVIVIALTLRFSIQIFGQVPPVYAGTIGEERENRNRYHTGFDLQIPDGTAVSTRYKG